MAAGTVFSSPAECRQKLEEYFGSYLQNNQEIADIESLADFFGITREDRILYMNDAKYGKILRLARNRIAKIKKQLAFNGKLQATVLTFDFKNNHGYKDKPEENESETEPVVFKGQVKKWAE